MVEVDWLCGVAVFFQLSGSVAYLGSRKRGPKGGKPSHVAASLKHTGKKY